MHCTQAHRAAPSHTSPQVAKRGFEAATERYQRSNTGYQWFVTGCIDSSMISRYREFIEKVWLPYAQQHETICAAVVVELNNHSPEDEVTLYST
jgi:hypothetical protein